MGGSPFACIYVYIYGHSLGEILLRGGKRERERVERGFSRRITRAGCLGAMAEQWRALKTSNLRDLTAGSACITGVGFAGLFLRYLRGMGDFCRSLGLGKRGCSVELSGGV